RSELTRGDLAKIVYAAVQAYFIRFALDANPLERRDLVTAIMQALLITPGAGEGTGRMPSHRGAVDAAKAVVQPVILERMDVAAAAEMPRAAFEAELTG